MKLLKLCVAAAIAAGMTAGPHLARAQALGEAATLGAGVSSTGSAPASTLGNSIGRAMAGEGRSMAPRSKSSTSGGVVNFHWSRQQLDRSARTTRTQTKSSAKAGSQKAEPDFVVFGADPQDQDEDSGDASVTQPKRASPSSTQPKAAKAKAPSGQNQKN